MRYSRCLNEELFRPQTINADHQSRRLATTRPASRARVGDVPLDARQTEATIWREALSLISNRVNEGTYRIWFEPTEGLEFSEETFLIGVPSPFAKDWIDTRFSALISDCLSEVLGDTVSCRIVVSPELADRYDEEESALDNEHPLQPTEPETLNTTQDTTPLVAGPNSKEDTRDPRPAPSVSLIHISEPTRLRRISYAVFCLKKKKKK